MTKKNFLTKAFYPFLLPVFFVVHGFTGNFYLITVKDSMILLGIYLTITLFFFFLFLWLFRKIEKAAFLTLLVTGFNFFFGYVHDGLKSVFPGTFLVRYSFILSMAFICFIVVAIMVRKRSISPGINKYFNVLFLVLILLEVGILTRKGIALLNKKDISSYKHEIHLSDSYRRNPDIYFIVADEYAGNNGLTAVCNYDNSDFLDTLRQRGFFVANNSRCNYDFTTFSMASTLYMDYLPVKKELIREADHIQALKFILNNNVAVFLKEAGYKIYNYSAFDMRDEPAKGKSPFIPSRMELLTSQTFVDRFRKDVWLNAARIFNLKGVLRKSLYENLVYNQEIYERSITITKSTDTAQKFVYTHLEMPHFPFYYDAQARPYSESFLWNDGPGNINNYVQYVKYTNQVLLKLIDEILHNNRTLPVIVLMSDHGYRCFPPGTASHAFDNLFSVYLPDKKYDQFNDSINTVNAFRALFNSIFNTRFGMLESKSFHVGE